MSKDWLMLGQGPMLLEPTASEASAPAAPPVAPAEAFEPPLPPPLRRRNPVDSALLQPADVAATVALAAAHAPRPAGPASSEAAPATVATPTAPVAPATSAAPTSALAPDPAYFTVALQTQYLQHQLALAEQRNQHLLEQQALMQQLVALLQRAI